MGKHTAIVCSLADLGQRRQGKCIPLACPAATNRGHPQQQMPWAP